MPDPAVRRMKWQMFALSFRALFLEMMVIRWVPSVVKLIAFYANLMLLSSFLGLGAGAMMARREKWKLFDYFPIFLALEIGTLFLCRNAGFSTQAPPPLPRPSPRPSRILSPQPTRPRPTA